MNCCSNATAVVNNVIPAYTIAKCYRACLKVVVVSIKCGTGTVGGSYTSVSNIPDTGVGVESCCGCGAYRSTGLVVSEEFITAHDY